eukprot:jgi/Chrpa1/21529/Chrysochromulina_OHIO_Genome00025733-RA
MRSAHLRGYHLSPRSKVVNGWRSIYRDFRPGQWLPSRPSSRHLLVSCRRRGCPPTSTRCRRPRRSPCWIPTGFRQDSSGSQVAASMRLPRRQWAPSSHGR